MFNVKRIGNHELFVICSDDQKPLIFTHIYEDVGHAKMVCDKANREGWNLDPIKMRVNFSSSRFMAAYDRDPVIVRGERAKMLNAPLPTRILGNLLSAGDPVRPGTVRFTHKDLKDC